MNRVQQFGKLTEEDVRFVLLHDSISQRQLADQFGVNMKTIHKIRIGETYKQVCPEIPRRNAAEVNRPTCSKCVHFMRDQCTMGFPEYAQFGTNAVYSCSTYTVAGAVMV